MKKLFLISVLFVLTLTAMSQTPLVITEGESTIVYALPKTELCIQVETEKTTLKPGMFYRYSERYLATKNVITEEKTSYRLKSVKVIPRPVPDPARTFSYIPSGQPTHISINANGILCGVNVPVDKEPECTITTQLPVKENSQQALLPLGEEYMMAGSEAKLAEGAAKQIYRIRESRLSLLTADQDKLPSDGDSFKSMLAGMNSMESQLTELFIGKTTKEVEIQTIYLIPVAAVANDVLFRLSAIKGLVSSDDLSGTPYYISIKPTDIRKSGNESRAKVEKTGIYSVLPSPTMITIGDGVNIVSSDQFLIPQFGILLPLSESLFKQPAVKVTIDSRTGQLLKVE
jgi:hypothetical protein